MIEPYRYRSGEVQDPDALLSGSVPPGPEAIRALGEALIAAKKSPAGASGSKRLAATSPTNREIPLGGGETPNLHSSPSAASGAGNLSEKARSGAAAAAKDVWLTEVPPRLQVRLLNALTGHDTIAMSSADRWDALPNDGIRMALFEAALLQKEDGGDWR